MQLVLPNDAFMGPNCGVTAVAIAAQKTMAQTWSAFTKKFNKKRQWKGGTYYGERVQILKEFGVKFIEFTVERQTLTKFCKEIANGWGKDKIFMVTTTGHVQMVRNNTVIDQGGPKQIENYYGRRKFIITEVIEIVPPADKAQSADWVTFGLPLFDQRK